MRAVAPTASIEIEQVVSYPGLDTDAEHPAVTFLKRLLGRNDYAKVPYGTEAGVFSARAGVVSVVCGPGSIAQAHKADEYLAVEEVEKCHVFLSRLFDALEAERLPW